MHLIDFGVFFNKIIYVRNNKTSSIQYFVFVFFFTARLFPTAVSLTPEALAETVKQTKKELTVEKKQTSSYKRSLTSAKDRRQSATYIGTGGVVILCSVLVALTLPDMFTFFRHCQAYRYVYKNLE